MVSCSGATPNPASLAPQDNSRTLSISPSVISVVQDNSKTSRVKIPANHVAHGLMPRMRCGASVLPGLWATRVPLWQVHAQRARKASMHQSQTYSCDAKSAPQANINTNLATRLASSARWVNITKLKSSGPWRRVSYARTANTKLHMLRSVIQAHVSIVHLDCYQILGHQAILRPVVAVVRESTKT